MARKLVIEFTKVHGAGNDFVVLDNRFYNFSGEQLTELAQRFCRRRTGIGADGLLALGRAEDPACDYRMHYLNADGSRAAMCGNGARCLAAFARQAGLDGEPLTFTADAGIYQAQVIDSGEAVRLFGPDPRDFEPEPLLESEAARQLAPLCYVWTGTEHVVTFIDDIEAAPVDTLGPEVRSDEALAPTGANVNFVEVIRPGDEQTAAVLRVRTFEKGVEAETRACGTGALAAAVSARRTGRTRAEKAAVEMPGGVLNVGFRLDGEAVTDLYLGGPVTTAFRGTVEW